MSKEDSILRTAKFISFRFTLEQKSYFTKLTRTLDITDYFSFPSRFVTSKLKSFNLTNKNK